jgi:hypothetical protein
MSDRPGLSSTAAYHKRQGVLASLISAGFVLLGMALGDEVPWYATAFFAACLVIGILMVFGVLPKEPAPDEHLTIDDAGITRTARKLREQVAWDDIARVRILTNDEGPWREDVFFVIDSRQGGGCVVPQELAVRGGLLEALQSRLPGINNAAVIEAMGSVERREFIIWQHT